jgi:hypothetical protein
MEVQQTQFCINESKQGCCALMHSPCMNHISVSYLVLSLIHSLALQQLDYLKLQIDV